MADHPRASELSDSQAAAADPGPGIRHHILDGLRGRIRFLVGQTPVIALLIDDGVARIVDGDGPADTTVVCCTREDVDDLLRGATNPIILGLLGRVEVEGDVELGLQVLMAAPVVNGHPTQRA
jgi:hypothetical protein